MRTTPVYTCCKLLRHALCDPLGRGRALDSTTLSYIFFTSEPWLEQHFFAVGDDWRQQQWCFRQRARRSSPGVVLRHIRGRVKKCADVHVVLRAELSNRSLSGAEQQPAARVRAPSWILDSADVFCERVRANRTREQTCRNPVSERRGRCRRQCATSRPRKGTGVGKDRDGDGDGDGDEDEEKDKDKDKDNDKHTDTDTMKEKKSEKREKTEKTKGKIKKTVENREREKRKNTGNKKEHKNKEKNKEKLGNTRRKNKERGTTIKKYQKKGKRKKENEKKKKRGRTKERGKER